MNRKVNSPKPPAKRGRRRGEKVRPRFEIDPRIRGIILGILAIGGGKNAACREAGVNPETLSNWLKRGETGEEPFASFARECDQAMERDKVTYLKTLNEAAKGGDWRAAAWVLEKKYPLEFGSRAVVEHTGKVEIDASVSVDMSGFKGRSEEEIEHYIAQGAFPDGTLPHPE